MLTDYVYWIFWIFIGLLIGVRARPQSRQSLFRILMLGAGFVIAGLVVGLASGHSVAQLLVFDRELEPAAVALEYRLIAFGYTLLFAWLLLSLRSRPSVNPDAASDSLHKKDAQHKLP